MFAMTTMRQLPNILTMSRIIVIPLIVISFYMDSPFAERFAAALFVFAGITDFFDGFLARAFSVQSRFGRFLDPIADKLLVVAILVMLVRFDRANELAALAIICREILVSGLREFIAELSINLPVSRLAKIKTAVQMLAIFMLLLGSAGSGIVWFSFVGQLVLWLAVGLTLATGYVYLRAGLVHMGIINDS
jgi:cardiolipin synthase